MSDPYDESDNFTKYLHRPQTCAVHGGDRGDRLETYVGSDSQHYATFSDAEIERFQQEGRDNFLAGKGQSDAKGHGVAFMKCIHINQGWLQAFILDQRNV